MQNISENTEDAALIPQQHSGLVSSMFRDYRNNFGLFWQVMLPLIIADFLLYIGIFLFFTLMSPEGQWTISTGRGLSAYTSSFQSVQSVRPVGVVWGFGFSATHIGLLWLAMCPLIFAIVQRRSGMDLTFKAVWQQTLRKTVPILGTAFLIGIVVLGVPVIFGFLAFEIFITEHVQASAPTLVFVFLCFIAAWFVLSAYFTVKWSLYNQGIMIENLSAIAALRRSSELVRGAWPRFFGIYLLLIWASMVLTSLLLSLTLVLLSFAVPELTPMREVLQPAKLVSLLVGGYGKMTVEGTPNFGLIGVIVSVQTLIYAILAPIWASLTTQLYMKRVDEHVQQVSA